MEEALQGRVTLLAVTNVSQFLIPPSLKRIKLVFIPPGANRVTYMPQDAVLVDLAGITQVSSSQVIEVVGQLAKMGWSVIGNAAGPFTAPIIEYYKSDYGEPNAK